MAMGRQKDGQGDLMVSWSEMPRSPGHVFYDRLQPVLIEGGFDAFAEASCRPYYAARMGAPSVPPGCYFRMHLVGYFEGIDSERGLEWRCSDSLSLRAFLRLGSRDRVPDHSWLSRSRTRLPHEVTSLSGPAPTGAGPFQTSHGLSEKPPLIRPAGARLLAGFRLLYSAGDPTQRNPFDVCSADLITAGPAVVGVCLIRPRRRGACRGRRCSGLFAAAGMRVSFPRTRIARSPTAEQATTPPPPSACPSTENPAIAPVPLWDRMHAALSMNASLVASDTARCSSLVSRRSDQVRAARDGAELRPDEDACATRGAGLAAALDITSLGADIHAGPERERCEGDAILLMRLLHAGGLQVRQDHFGEICCLAVAELLVGMPLEEFVVLVHRQHPVRRQALDAARPRMPSVAALPTPHPPRRTACPRFLLAQQVNTQPC